MYRSNILIKKTKGSDIHKQPLYHFILKKYSSQADPEKEMHSESALNLRYIAGEIYTPSHSPNISMIDNSNALLLLLLLSSHDPFVAARGDSRVTTRRRIFWTRLETEAQVSAKEQKIYCLVWRSLQHRSFSKSIQNIEKRMKKCEFKMYKKRMKK